MPVWTSLTVRGTDGTAESGSNFLPEESLINLKQRKLLCLSPALDVPPVWYIKIER